MKRLILLAMVIVAFGYLSYHFIAMGMGQIEKTTQIQAKAQERLQIVRQIIGDNQSESSRVVQEGAGVAHAEPQIDVVRHQKMTEVCIGDSISVVLLRLGNPPGEERDNDLRILRYSSCNIVVQRDTVIGWLLK